MEKGRTKLQNIKVGTCRCSVSNEREVSRKYRPLTLHLDVISLNDPNEGIPMPLMHDMLFEDSFRHSV